MNKKQFAYLFFLMCFGFTAIMGWSFYYEEKNRKEKNKPQSLPDRIMQLQESYNRFKSMTGKQLYVEWNDLFFDSEYKLNGQMKNDKYDCISAETTFWKRLGANVVLENTENKERRLARICPPHTSIKTVKVGDIIIFKANHISIVNKVGKRTLRYMDINVADDGEGLNVIDFKDRRIQAIYPTTFDYWCGDILYNNKK